MKYSDIRTILAESKQALEYSSSSLESIESYDEEDRDTDGGSKACKACVRINKRAVAKIDAALAALAQDTDGVAKREVAWLIERKFPPTALWYAENVTGFHWWASDANLAKRFASKADAEAFPAYQMIASDPAISVTEHVFWGANP